MDTNHEERPNPASTETGRDEPVTVPPVESPPHTSGRGGRRPQSPVPAELPPKGIHPSEVELLEQVSVKEARKLRARAQRHKGMWFGLGMFGLVGWSVAIPTIAAIALGVWLDTRFPSQYSWTLMLLVVGIALGCFNAWYWVAREREKL